MKEELEKLREEVAALRREIEQLRAGGVHHHHYPQPSPWTQPVIPVTPYSPPVWYSTC